jgi:hypothetical protein
LLFWVLLGLTGAISLGLAQPSDAPVEALILGSAGVVALLRLRRQNPRPGILRKYLWKLGLFILVIMLLVFPVAAVSAVIAGVAVGVLAFGRARIRRGTGAFTGRVNALHYLLMLQGGAITAHSRRVAANAVTMGRFIGLTDDEVESLKWSALLHDVGMTALPNRILEKPVSLSESEIAQVRHHCQLGAQLVIRASHKYELVAGVIHSHHERWDGKGYPSGLAGEAVPLLARVLSIADAYEALTSARPYRQALDSQDAVAVIRSESGLQFDPSLVEVFDCLSRTGGLKCTIEHGRTETVRVGTPASATRMEEGVACLLSVQPLLDQRHLPTKI